MGNGGWLPFRGAVNAAEPHDENPQLHPGLPTRSGGFLAFLGRKSQRDPVIGYIVPQNERTVLYLNDPEVPDARGAPGPPPVSWAAAGPARPSLRMVPLHHALWQGTWASHFLGRHTNYPSPDRGVPGGQRMRSPRSSRLTRPRDRGASFSQQTEVLD